LNRVLEVIFLMMIPLTLPASEFHRTWSAILNVLGIETFLGILSPEHPDRVNW
jgi:hypothetical protein